MFPRTVSTTRRVHARVRALKRLMSTQRFYLQGHARVQIFTYKLYSDTSP